MFKYNVFSGPWCYPGLYCTQMEKLNVSNVTEYVRVQDINKCAGMLKDGVYEPCLQNGKMLNNL